MAEKSNSSNHLLFAIITGVIVGILLGGFFPEAGQQVQFLGELFIRALLALVVPLVITSMIVGITALGDVRKLGGLGGRTLLYFMTTTAIAVIIGLALVVSIKPGKAGDTASMARGETLTESAYEVRDNLLTLGDGRFARKYDATYSVELLDQPGVHGVVEKDRDLPDRSLRVKGWIDLEGRSKTPRATGSGVRVFLTVSGKFTGETPVWKVVQDVLVGLVPKNIFQSMANNELLPIIVFSLAFGAVLTTIQERGDPVIKFFDGANAAIMEIVNLLMWTAPVGIAGLIAGRLGEAGGFLKFGEEFMRLGAYAGTVLLGLAIHGAIVLPLILYFIARPPHGIAKFAGGMMAALTTAFSTDSSSATLPMTLECVEKNGVSERISCFVLPLGATVNMNGTALYEAIAAVFIAQLYGIELPPAQLVIVFLTATLAAIGAAGIPEAGLVTMVIVLKAVDLPVEGIALILIIDWFLDRCRTMVNVWGDAVGAAVIERLELGRAAAAD